MVERQAQVPQYLGECYGLPRCIPRAHRLPARLGPTGVLEVGGKLIAVRLYHRPEALNGCEGIRVSGGQLLRSLKPFCYFTLERNEFHHAAANYLKPQIDRHSL